MKISQYFTLDEVIASDKAAELGIDNSIKDYSILSSAAELARALDQIREEFGPFSPNSWYRCEELNKAVGGSSNSHHLTGSAVDISIKGVPTLDLFKFIALNFYGEIILTNYDESDIYSGFVHFAEDWKLEKSILVGNDGYYKKYDLSKLFDDNLDFNHLDRNKMFELSRSDGPVFKYLDILPDHEESFEYIKELNKKIKQEVRLRCLYLDN